MSERNFYGEIDEFGFPYLIVGLVNPETNKSLHNLKAIIDTGAAYSHVKQTVIDDLGIHSVKEVTVNHLTDGNVKSGVFVVNIILNNNLKVSDMKMRILHQKDYPSELVIGLDILKHCNFQYDSVERLFSFHLYP